MHISRVFTGKRRFPDDENTAKRTTVNKRDIVTHESIIHHEPRMSFVGQPSFFGRDDMIAVPARLPMILKQFCKAAIRTQPYDLLKWSSSYFRALADGEEPPVKSRLEYPTPTVSVLTVGFLRVLLRQFGSTINKKHRAEINHEMTHARMYSSFFFHF